eukprot:31375-Pelagococcus_subviridis.AAC.11
MDRRARDSRVVVVRSVPPFRPHPATHPRLSAGANGEEGAREHRHEEGDEGDARTEKVGEIRRRAAIQTRRRVHDRGVDRGDLPRTSPHDAEERVREVRRRPRRDGGFEHEPPRVPHLRQEGRPLDDEVPVQGSRVHEHARPGRRETPGRGRRTRGRVEREGRVRPAVHARRRERRAEHGRQHEPTKRRKLGARFKPLRGHAGAGLAGAVPTVRSGDADIRRVQPRDGGEPRVRVRELREQGRREQSHLQAGRVRVRQPHLARGVGGAEGGAKVTARDRGRRTPSRLRRARRSRRKRERVFLSSRVETPARTRARTRAR